jgi:hypothetical protein
MRRVAGRILAAALVAAAEPTATKTELLSSLPGALYVSEASGMFAYCYAKPGEAEPRRIVWSRDGRPVVDHLGDQKAAGYTSWTNGYEVAAALEAELRAAGIALVPCPSPYRKVLYGSDGTVLARSRDDDDDREGRMGTLVHGAMVRALPHLRMAILDTGEPGAMPHAVSAAMRPGVVFADGRRRSVIGAGAVVVVVVMVMAMAVTATAN